MAEKDLEVANKRIEELEAKVKKMGAQYAELTHAHERTLKLMDLKDKELHNMSEKIHLYKEITSEMFKENAGGAKAQGQASIDAAARAAKTAQDRAAAAPQQSKPAR